MGQPDGRKRNSSTQQERQSSSDHSLLQNNVALLGFSAARFIRPVK
jgi:hypothetical protein